MNNQAPLIFVCYDGIDNSVFESQVITPLRKCAKQNSERPLYLISFEKDPASAQLPVLDFKVHVTFFKKHIFLGRWSLFLCIRSLHTYLKQFPLYTLKARGPLAGYISLQAAQNTKCSQIIIQARGLLAAEYEYTYQAASFLKRVIHRQRTKWYAAIEHHAYKTNIYPFDVTIESVSKALAKWIVDHFNASSKAIIIAAQDIPQSISQADRLKWRAETRSELNIHQAVPVYCYNGSAHAWQLPDATIGLFKQILVQKPHAVLLILTRGVTVFDTLIAQFNIDQKNYRIKSVNHEDIYRYLSAADAGIILREPHPINWISRPTKVLEYRAVGLPILHNHTIAMLTHGDYNSNPAIIAESKLESEPPRTA